MNELQMPQDKHDVETVEALMGVSETKIEPYIWELLEWLQDWNWPVAQPVAKVLSHYGEILVEPIRKILNGDDDLWKYWIASFLFMTKPEVRTALFKDILRIVQDPTPGETHEEVPEVMQEVLDL